MRQNNFLPIIIFSAYLSGLDDKTNKRRHHGLKMSLAFDGIPFEEVTGCYNGRFEESVLVSAEHEDVIREIAKEWGQETILISECDRWTRLDFINTNGKTLDLGTLQPISKEEAETLQSYTIRDGVYYACKN